MQSTNYTVTIISSFSKHAICITYIFTLTDPSVLLVDWNMQQSSFNKLKLSVDNLFNITLGRHNIPAQCMINLHYSWS